MSVSFSSDNICDELIPSTGNDVQQSNPSDHECLSIGDEVLRIGHVQYQKGWYEFGDGEEHLMIPLRVKVVVPIVYVHPPRVVVRKYSAGEEDEHARSQASLECQPSQVLDGFVKNYNTDDNGGPHFQWIRRGVEVHVLVRGHSRLVRTWKKVYF